MLRFEMNDAEKIEYQSVVLAALLHDIGKFLHRRNDVTCKIGHNRASASFIEDHDKKLRNNLYDLELVKFLALHHMEEDGESKDSVLNDAIIESKKIEKERLWALLTIVRNADIYSCAEREHTKQTRFADPLEPLNSIFQKISLNREEPTQTILYNHHLNILDPLKCFPDVFQKLGNQEFGHLIEHFVQNLPDFSQYTEFNHLINKWLDTLQQYTCNVTSDTRYDAPDVSLYDHSRSTAAFAACLYKRHLESIRNNKRFTRPYEFILIGGDYSGIQDYIFHITNRGSGGASKRLRARSFFVQLFADATIHKILDALNLPMVCNLFSAGGKFLILAPNIEGIEETLKQVKSQMNAEISRTYFNQFSFLISWMDFNAHKDSNDSKRGLKNQFGIYTFYQYAETMFHRLEAEKNRKFSTCLIDADTNKWQTEAFKGTQMYSQYTETGDCKICGGGPATKEDLDYETNEVTPCCPVCFRDKYLIGEALPKAKFIAFGKGMFDEGKDKDKIVLFRPNGSHAGYYAELLKSVDQRRPEHYLVYGLNPDKHNEKSDEQRQILRKHYANHVPIEGNKILSFEEIAKKSLWKNTDGKYYGSILLGVLKVDIDNLGLIFSKGFEKPSQSEKDLPDIDRKTVSRFLTLSRMIELFFSGWVKEIMTAGKAVIIKDLLAIQGMDKKHFEDYLNSDAVDFQNIYTVYSGGDDLLLVGPWETMIVFAEYMNIQFRKYTCNHLSLSAGLAFIKEAHPIASAIKQADELLEKSKKTGKNAISLFQTTIQWDYLPELINFFLFLDKEMSNSESNINTSFLHRLLEYHRMAMRFIENGRTEGLKYISALSYDIGRNILKRDKEGKPIKGQAESNFLHKKLIDTNPREADSPIYRLKIPLFWCLYRNRRALDMKEGGNING